MRIPTYNAPPVAKFFLFTRCLQLFIAVLLIGIIANFIATTSSSPASTSPTSPTSTSTPVTTTSSPNSASTSSASASPPAETILILTTTSLSALYILITLPFFLSGAQTGLLIMCLLDFCWVVAYTVAAVLVGHKISHVSCLGIKNVTLAGAGSGGMGLGLTGWVEASRINCWVGKGAWGLCVAGAVVFAASGLVAPALFAKVRRARKA